MCIIQCAHNQLNIDKTFDNLCCDLCHEHFVKRNQDISNKLMWRWETGYVYLELINYCLTPVSLAVQNLLSFYIILETEGGHYWVYCLLDSNHDNSARLMEVKRLIVWLTPLETANKWKQKTSIEQKFVLLFENVTVDAPTDVVHSDGAGLNVEGGDFGRCVHQNIWDLNVVRERAGEFDLEVVDDRSVSAGMERLV